MTSRRDRHGDLPFAAERRRRRDLRMAPVVVVAWATALVVVIWPASAPLVASGGVMAAVGTVLAFVLAPVVVPVFSPAGARVLAGRVSLRRLTERPRRRPAATGVRRLGLPLVCAAVVVGVAATAWSVLPAREAARSGDDRTVTAELRVSSMPTRGADGRIWADVETERLGPPREMRELRVPVRIGMKIDDGAARVAPGSELRVVARMTLADGGERQP